MDNHQFQTEILTFAQQLTQAVGAQLLQQSGRVTAAEKADGSLVTQADQWADETLRTAIAAKFPDHGLLSEETSHQFPDRPWCWVIDPIDGTTNFTRGIPLWGISLGLLYRGEPVFGLVYLPPVNQCFHGFYPGATGLAWNGGAFLNGTAIRPSGAEPNGNQIFNLCARSLEVLQQPVPCKIRLVGVATYNVLMVAQGTALAGIEATPKVWDLAAVWAIAKAAGAEIISLEQNSPFPLIPQENYGHRPMPSLILSRRDLLPIFLPLVQSVGDRVAAAHALGPRPSSEKNF